jgi:uncharacterized protein YjiS (DUF1127 family)
MPSLHGSIAQGAIVHPQHSTHLGRNERRCAETARHTERKTTMTTQATAAAWRSWLPSIEGLSDRWRRYRLFRRTYAELDALTTRELDDLGISRSMITRLAYEAAYGRNA